MGIEKNEAASKPIGLADPFKSRTRSLHREAERSGILPDLLRSRAGREAYVLLLRNLLPVYEALEQELDRAGPALSGFAEPDLCRADLDHIAGPRWAETIPLLPSALALCRADRNGRGQRSDPAGPACLCPLPRRSERRSDPEKAAGRQSRSWAGGPRVLRFPGCARPAAVRGELQVDDKRDDGRDSGHRAPPGRSGDRFPPQHRGFDGSQARVICARRPVDERNDNRRSRAALTPVGPPFSRRRSPPCPHARQGDRAHRRPAGPTRRRSPAFRE